MQAEGPKALVGATLRARGDSARRRLRQPARLRRTASPAIISSRCGSPSGRIASGAQEQPAHRAEVAARVSAVRCGYEPCGRAPSEAVEPGVGAVELGAIAIRPLEVVADDLVLLDERYVLVEPVGELLVELCAGLLRAGSRRRRRGSAGGGSGRPLRRGSVGWSGRIISLRTSERRWVGTSARSSCRRELAARCCGGTPALRRAPRPIMSRSPVPSRSSLDCRSAWIVGGTTISASAPFSLTSASISSMKSGLPSAACRIRRRAIVWRGPRRPRAARSDSSQSSPDSASSRIVVAFSLPPPQPGRSSSSSGRATQSREDRRIPRPVGDVLDQVEEDRLGPLDVVEDHDLRAFGSASLEQLAERELRVGR